MSRYKNDASKGIDRVHAGGQLPLDVWIAAQYREIVLLLGVIPTVHCIQAGKATALLQVTIGALFLRSATLSIDHRLGRL